MKTKFDIGEKVQSTFGYIGVIDKIIVQAGEFTLYEFVDTDNKIYEYALTKYVEPYKPKFKVGDFVVDLVNNIDYQITGAYNSGYTMARPSGAYANQAIIDIDSRYKLIDPPKYNIGDNLNYVGIELVVAYRKYDNGCWNYKGREPAYWLEENKVCKWEEPIRKFELNETVRIKTSNTYGKIVRWVATVGTDAGVNYDVGLPGATWPEEYLEKASVVIP